MKKKDGAFTMIFHYLKDDKFKIFIYVLLIICTMIPGLATAYFFGLATENLVVGNFKEFTLYLITWSSLLVLFYVIFMYPREKIYNDLEIKFIRGASKDLFKKINDLPAIAFEETGTGEFINRLRNDPDKVVMLLSKLIRMICKSIVLIIIVVMAFSISLLLGFEIIALGIVMFLISYKFFPKIKKTHEDIKKETDIIAKKATESISGIREVKSLGIKKNIEKNLFSIYDKMFLHEKKIRQYENVYYSLNNLIFYILQFIILLTAGYYVSNGTIAFSVFVMFETYIWRIDDVAQSISDFGVNYNKVKVSLNRINEIVNNKLYDDEKFGHTKLDNCNGVIDIENVKFRYKDDEKYTLDGLNLKIEPNKKIAIVGRSGNGKSTIFNLLLRYFDVSEGEIKLDGININDLTEDALRKNISVIRQSPYIFNMSIYENFKIAAPNTTLGEIRKVCKQAYIDDYIMSLPDKYDTIIGEGGVNLSGGQKQRLAIARTLLLDTKVILFDEATSALDNESQEYIKKTIDNLVKDHTVVIVAHRLSTIVDADIINVINRGKLVASGIHEDLMKKSDIYKSLYQSES